MGIIGLSEVNGVCFSFSSSYKMVGVLEFGESLGDIVLFILEVLGATDSEGSEEETDDDAGFYFLVVV